MSISILQNIIDTLKKYQNAIVSADQAIVQAAESEATFHQAGDAVLAKKMEESLAAEKKVQAFFNIAKAHTRASASFSMPKPLDIAALSRLALQINNTSSDDPYAAKLQNEAAAQLAGILRDRETIKSFSARAQQDSATRQEEKVQQVRQKKAACIREVEQFVSSALFVSFINSLREKSAAPYIDDETLFGSKGVSVGTFDVAMPIPQGTEQLLKNAFAGYLSVSGEKGILHIPAFAAVKPGSVFLIEYATNTEQQVLSGIQNILINLIRQRKDDLNHILFLDPIRFNSDGLGCLAELTDTGDSLLESVPPSAEQIKIQLSALINDPRRNETLLCVHNFPHGYDPTTQKIIQQLCANASGSGLTVLLTQNVASKSFSADDVLSFIESFAIPVVYTQDRFYMEAGHSEKVLPLNWHVAPQKLPADIRALSVRKETADLSNSYEDRVGYSFERSLQKGIRRIVDIPYGIDEAGNVLSLDFEDSNFASFICGAARSGKSTLLHTIITGILKQTHPDDVEIWLIDFKMTEFSRYTKNTPPHIRYIMLDESPEMVYDILDRLTEILQKRQNIFKGAWEKLSDVPPEKYMPALFVIIDEFSVMSQIVAESAMNGQGDYAVKLQALLAKGAALGMHFIFASQGFTTGTRGLNDFAKLQVQQRIAMKTEFNEIRETLDLKSTSDTDKAMMEQLVPHYALARIPMDKRGNHLQQTHVLYIDDYSKQEAMIRDIRRMFTPCPRYDVGNSGGYIDKQTLVIDGNNYHSFDENADKIRMALHKRQAAFLGDDFTYLFPGEPRRMMETFPLDITNGFCENILIIASLQEKMAAASVLLSIRRSLQLQGKELSLWTSSRDSLYRQLAFSCGVNLSAAVDLDDVCEQIHQIKQKIQQKIPGDRFIVLTGFETLMQDMTFQEKSSLGETAFSGGIERRQEGEPDINTQLAALAAGFLSAPAPAPAETFSVPDITASAAYDAREDLKFILTQGPRLGYHFIMLFHSAAEVDQCRIDTSLFRHKCLFLMPKADAMPLVGSIGAAAVSELTGHSFRYTNGIEQLSFRPYLHPGLTWDGWQLDGSSVVSTIEEEEYLL